MFLKKEMIYTKYVQSFCLFKISYKIFLLIIINILLINSSHSNEKKDILFIGDSLTSGYGLNKGKDFVSELNQITSKRYNRFNLITMGVSGDTTSGGLSRIEWSLSSNTEAVIIILGANDMLRGIPPEITKKNLNAMIEICFEKGVDVMLVGQKAPNNFGIDYKKKFDEVFSDLKDKHKILLYPYFFQAILENDDLTTLNKYLLEDKIHPNNDGIKVIVNDFQKTFFKFLDSL